jgi:hypothetical protein
MKAQDYQASRSKRHLLVLQSCISGVHRIFHRRTTKHRNYINFNIPPVCVFKLKQVGLERRADNGD